MLTDGFGNSADAFAGRAELYAAFLDIRTGNVQFNHVNIGIGKNFRHTAVIFLCTARYIGNGHCILLFQPREVFFNKMLYTRILQTDCIQHTHRGFCNTGRRIAGTFIQSRTFTGNTAKNREGIKFTVFMTEADRAGCRNDRIFEGHTCYFYT